MTGEGGITRAEVQFRSSLLESGQVWVTKLVFDRVLDFRFYDFELGLHDRLPNPNEVEYALVRIESSDLISAFAESGALRQTAKPVVDLPLLQHYRIAFDDHGIYDIVCLDLKITSYRAMDRLHEE